MSFVSWLVVVFCALVFSEVWGQTTREDGRCGPNYPAPDGGPAECDYIPPFPTCCTASEHCGWDCDTAPAVVTSDGLSAAPAAAPAQQVKTTKKPTFVSTGKYRADGRCGAQFPLESTGEPAECDPNSQYWCCSEHGFCGGSQEHCYCDTCVNYRPVELVGDSNKVRSDRRCGAEFPLDDGKASECDGEGPNYCCSKFGYCGPGAAHCDGGVDYRPASALKVKSVSNGKVRGDRRCGSEFPADDGSPGECDGTSANPCCSKWGYCGPGADHCSCPGCKDFRPIDQLQDDFVGKVRKDRRCGKDFPLPGEKKLPSQCDPESDNYCCSKWGYCGGDAEHCDCESCFNYRLVAAANRK